MACKKEYEDILLEKWNDNWGKLFKGANDTFQAVVGGSISASAEIGEAVVDVAAATADLASYVFAAVGTAVDIALGDKNGLR
jgi:putative sterol carrier protein